MKRFFQRLIVSTLVCCGSVFAQTETQSSQSGSGSEDTPWFQQTPDNRKFALVIAGASANNDIRVRLRSWATDLHTSLLEDYGYDRSNIELLIDDGDNVGNAASIVSGSSRVGDIEAAIERIRRSSEAGDQLTLFLFGHGSSTFGDAKFNNVGPDMTGGDLANMLGTLNGVDIVVFNTTSASFEFSRELSVLGRVVVSATRSAAERYDPLFGGFVVTALQQKRADIDRNGRVSVLEAFNYASGQIAQWYRDQDRLSTENAVLDDSGDGLFSREPGTGQPDGLLAEIAYVDVITAGTQKTSTEALRLFAQMQTVEREIFILRNQKVNYLEEDYWYRLEALLIDLATRTRRYNELP